MLSESAAEVPTGDRTVVAARRRTWAVTTALATAGYSALACLVTFPLVLELSSRVPLDLEDSLWYVTVLWWNANVLPLTQRWWDGFAFYPASGMMAFSDHMLGASLIASPLQWLGLSPLTAYNLTFLATFPLSALAAHALGWTLTRRHDAAMICGLAFGFSPYRVAHLAHLELLMAFGMPLALLALHQYTATRHVRWLAVFTAALALQGLSASYYTLFFGVLGGLWIVWFVRPRAWRDVLAMLAAGSVAALVMLPIAIGYSRIHDRHNLARDVTEVIYFSADVTSVVTASAFSALWGWTSPLNGGERQLFPGLTIAVLAMAGVAATRRFRAPVRDRAARLSAICWALSACALLVAAASQVAGPWSLDWGWLRVSVSGLHKPLSVSVAFAAIATALSPTVRAAFRRRSPFAFYVLAAVVLFLFSLGPAPTFLGVQVLYEAPYAWLMRLPLFSDSDMSMPTVRVPARFAMPAVLALSVAGGLAFARLTSSRRRRVTLAAAAIAGAGIVADGWIAGMPLHDLPATYRVPADVHAAAVLELPLGTIRRDTAAMYRATQHLKPTLNGYHSYAPLSYHILRLALDTRDDSALDAVASLGPVLIAADNTTDAAAPWASFVAARPDAVRLGDDAHWTLFQVPHTPMSTTRCDGPSVPIAAIVGEDGMIDPAPLTDGNPATLRRPDRPQRAGDQLILHLARTERLCGLVLSPGVHPDMYPRALRVATSLDADTWETQFSSAMGGTAVMAAIENPHNLRLVVPLGGVEARVIRLQLDASHPLYPWAVADIVVHALEP